jgi:transposase-like protein
MRQLKAELLAKWRGLVLEQSQSGQTVNAFCRDRGLRDSLFYDWKKRLREGETVQFVEVKVKEPVEQRKPAPQHCSAIEIRLNKGRSLSVEPGFDANHLRALLAVLEAEA